MEMNFFIDRNEYFVYILGLEFVLDVSKDI